MISNSDENIRKMFKKDKDELLFEIGAQLIPKPSQYMFERRTRNILTAPHTQDYRGCTSHLLFVAISKDSE